MIVHTNHPILENRNEITSKIAKFWDQLSLGWSKIWGIHIHHGYYENNEAISPREAQEKLIEKLAEMLPISSNSQILDVGCGMGGSSVFLAKNYSARVTGITLSSKQISIANQHAQAHNVKNVTFKIEDALTLKSFADNTFDIVWSLESCEQFFDKNLFIKNAYRVLKPGGHLLLATWCSDQDQYENQLAKDYKKLCLAFDLPYMPTMGHYRTLLTMQNFNIQTELDWSHNVEKSWDIGISLLNSYSFIKILFMSGWRGLRFAQQIKLMNKAFQEQRVRYGTFIAQK